MANQTENVTSNKSFFSNMVTELKKVIWPTGSQTVKSTATTITFVLVISFIIVALNFIFEAISNLWWSNLA